MTEEQQLLTRFDALVDRLNQAEGAIQSPDFNSRLYERVGPDFLRMISDERKRILQGKRVAKRRISSETWIALQAYERNCGTLFAECLAVLQAAGRAQYSDVDANTSQIAESLLDELSRATRIEWYRCTVLATEELFGDKMQIIRLRFPNCGIWDLPVAAHEFGHFIGGRLNIANENGSHSLAFQDYKSSFRQNPAGLGDEWMFYLEEYFADVFATFALGPAYALTCILLRFDPAAANVEEDKKHPSYAKRLRAVWQTLLRMNIEEDSKGEFAIPADTVRGFWDQAVVGARQSAIIPDNDSNQIDGLVSSYYEMLKRGVPQARFNRWAAALKMAPTLTESPTEHVPSANFGISELLNAAWICRLKPGCVPTKIITHANRLYHNEYCRR